MGDADSRQTVFLSYARSDQEQAARLAAALEAAGLTVWWDQLIDGGAPFAESIEATLNRCDAVVVCWSRSSAKSDWVRDEAGRGRDLHKLVAVTLDGSEPPMGFRQYHAVDLSRWNGAPSDASIASIVRGVESVTGRSTTLSATRDDHQTEPPRAGSGGAPRRYPKPHAKWIAAAAIAVAVITTGILGYERWFGVGTNRAITDGPLSIAVLPFKNLSQDPDADYLSDGLTDELISRLSLIPQLQVTARTSSYSFKDKTGDTKSVAQKLGVRHIIEGNVRRAGKRIRVTAQLVDAEQGDQLWSDVFDRDPSQLLTIQDEIASAVGKRLGVSSLATHLVVPDDRFSRDPIAVENYLRGRYLYQTWAVDRIDKGIAYLDEAIRIDPSFAVAYVAKAEALFARAQSTAECCDPGGAWMEPRRQLLRRALELDPNNADAIASTGLDLMMAREFEGAEKALRQAEAINPKGELVLRYLNMFYQGAGWPPEAAIPYAQELLRRDPLNVLAANGLGTAYWQAQQYEQALAMGDKAIELDPNSWLAHWLRSGALLDLGRYEETIQAAKKAIELSDGTGNVYADLVAAYAGAGKLDEARKIFRKIDAPDYKPPWRNAFKSYALVAIGEHDQAIAAIEQAYRENDGFLYEVVHYKALMPLHDDPRFQDIVRRLGQERRVQHTRDVVRARELASKRN